MQSSKDYQQQFQRLLLLSTIMCSLLVPVADSGKGTESQLYRPKRYVVFPEGSSFSIALCMTIHTLTPDNIFTEGLNWGISYDLPNESKPELEPYLQLRQDRIKPGKYNKYSYAANNNKDETKYEKQYYKKPENIVDWNNEGKYYLMPGGKKYYKADYHYLQRRHRRDLYNKLEVIINAMGFNGRSCILRALCEASQRFMPKGNSLVEEMMRIVFALPLSRVFSFEPEEHHTYTAAHKAGHEGRNCPAMFPSCSFSLIDMALGKYSSSDDDVRQDTGYPDTNPETFLPPDLRYTMK